MDYVEIHSSRLPFNGEQLECDGNELRPDGTCAKCERVNRRIASQVAPPARVADCGCGHSGLDHREEQGTGAARECYLCSGCTGFYNVHMALAAVTAERDTLRANHAAEVAAIKLKGLQSLNNYGSHMDDCEWWGSTPKQNCTCGYSDVCEYFIEAARHVILES